jgi:UDP-N-acetylmuramoyl-tripeptide--D-alanyl-D-alanine ligase
MIPMTLAEIALVVGGTVDGDPATLVDAPAFVDSRQVETAGLFVAIVGERVDGHDYAAAAHESGAAGVLGSRPTGVPTVVVDDPVVALGRLAGHVRDRLTATVIALTGSQGKTGTKDYLAQVLATAGATVATAGNNNNEIGVPLTILKATAETRYLVLEMGARGLGHVAYLCDFARPTIAGVLNVGVAHVGEFGSREAIAVAKGEIVEALPADGVAVLNADDPFTVALGSRTDAHTVTFGEAGDVRWSAVSFDDLDRPTVTFHHGDRERRVTLRQVGQHQLANAAAAIAFALGAGLDFAQVVDALGSAVSLSRWRMELTERPDGVVVINDSYNANPASMRAGLDALAAIGERRGARTVAVLGEMRELGAETVAGHHDIGAYAARLGVDVLLVVGDLSRPMLDGAATWGADGETTAVHAADRAEALLWLRENIAPGDVVLVKASRGAELDKVAAALVDEEIR